MDLGTSARKPTLDRTALGCCVALALAGCGSPETLTSLQIVLQSSEYEGETVELIDRPFQNGATTTGVGCTTPGPCNNVWGDFVLAGTRVFTRPSATFPAEPVARGVTPLPCFDVACENGTNLGCHGNDTEAFCAPTLPENIETAVGRIVRVGEGPDSWVFEVDAVTVVADPVASDGIFHAVE